MANIRINLDIMDVFSEEEMIVLTGRNDERMWWSTLMSILRARYVPTSLVTTTNYCNSCHLLGIYCMPGIVQRRLQTWSHLIFRNNLVG